MRVSIDGARCQGHLRCMATAPDVFTADEEGRGVIIDPQVAPAHERDVVRAAASCPETAVVIKR
jgi:ferredoxin